MIVIVSADELRRAGAAISYGFSWEQTLSELCSELNRNPLFQSLLHFPRSLIVSFGCVGAVWFCDPMCPGAPAEDRARLVYDPTLPEGGWETLLADDHDVYGNLNAFTAAIALAASGLPNGSELDLNVAIEFALAACRLLRLYGHGEVSVDRPGPPFKQLKLLLSAKSGDPVFKKLIPQGLQFVALTRSVMDAPDSTSWTLAALAENPPDQPQLPLYGLAHRVALYGEVALQHIPHAHFGVMLSVDRQEIETLRSLSCMILNYKTGGKQKQPLCLAAFGPPGAGKSFGIKEISKQVLGDNVPILEFNLSQYNEPTDLIGAFHQVRDKCLQGDTPVVFWDEFDSRDYKWLQYLLAPMQDGTFQEAGHTHTLGKCVFVFAGGTSWDFEHFGPAPFLHDGAGEEERKAYESRNADDSNLQKSEEEARADFRKKKGPDFISRLDGHINVLGPNQRLFYKWSTRQWEALDLNDITFPIRRALLLRQFLGAKKPKDVIDIDRDLLRAFLHVPRYSHGARSLEKIATPLGRSGAPFRRAHLPPPQVFHQHVSTAKEFDAIYEVNREFVTRDNLVTIAAAIANYYDEIYGTAASRTADEARTAFNAKMSSKDMWEQWLAATNIAAAQRLPNILALAGLRLERGRAEPEEIAKVSEHLKRLLDPLSREEHALWVQFHLDNGWRQANERQLKELAELRTKDKTAYDAEIKRLKKDERVHTLLVPFNKLPEDEKPKDYDAIKNYPKTVTLVDWKIVFVTGN